MSQTDQRPLRFDLCKSTQQELTKLAHMFDLGEHRFDDYVAALVDLVAIRSLELSPHLFANAVIEGLSASASSFHSRLIIGRHVQVNFLQLFVCDAGWAKVPGIGSRLFRQSPQILLYPIQSRQQLFNVIGSLHYSCSDDDLRLPINCYLGVIGLLKA